MGVDGILVGFPVAPQDKEPSPVLQWVFINLNHCVSFYVAKAPLAVLIKKRKVWSSFRLVHGGCGKTCLDKLLILHTRIDMKYQPT